MGSVNPSETGGNGAHALVLPAYLQGTGDGHLKGMRHGGSVLAPVLPEIYVRACCSLQATNAQGSGDQQKEVSAGGCVRRDCSVLESPLVGSAYLRTTCLQGPGALSCF